MNNEKGNDQNEGQQFNLIPSKLVVLLLPIQSSRLLNNNKYKKKKKSKIQYKVNQNQLVKTQIIILQVLEKYSCGQIPMRVSMQSDWTASQNFLSQPARIDQIYNTRICLKK
jgi:hypothetical protein